MENRINKIHGQLIEDVRVPEIEKRVVQLEEGGQGGGNINLANIDVQYIENFGVITVGGGSNEIAALRVTNDLKFTEIMSGDEYITSVNDDIISGKNVAIMYSANSYMTDDIIKNNVEPNIETYFLGKGAGLYENATDVSGTPATFEAHCWPLAPIGVGTDSAKCIALVVHKRTESNQIEIGFYNYYQ